MQSIVSGVKVEDDTRKDAILEVMSDKYCRGILENTGKTKISNGD